MRALFTAIVAAVEAAAVALAGLVMLLVPAALMLVLTFGLSADPGAVFGGAVGLWFLAHLVPLAVEIPSDLAIGMGLPQENINFVISLVPLGITLLTVLLGTRSGWRFGARGGAGAGAVLGALVGFAVIAAIALPFASGRGAWPSWAVVIVPACVYGVGVLIGFLSRAVTEQHPWWVSAREAVRTGLERGRLPGAADIASRTAVTVRVATATVMAVLGLAALGLAVSLVFGYVSVATVSQSLHLDVLGVVLMFLLQLALLPVAIIWAVAWFSGAGFSIGIGTSVSPFETLLGPLPSLPLFGAVPASWGAFALLAPALVVVVGVVVGRLFFRNDAMRLAHWGVVTLISVAAALITGLVFAALGALARGAIGPDRLAENGAQPWLMAGLIAAETCVGLVLGAFAARMDTSRIREAAASLPLVPARRAEVSATELAERVQTDPERLSGRFTLAERMRRTAPARSDAGSETTTPHDAPTEDLGELLAPEPEQWGEGRRHTELDAARQPEPEPASQPASDPANLPDHTTEPETSADREPAADADHANDRDPEPERVTSVDAEDSEASIDDLIKAFSWDTLDEAPLPPRARPESGDDEIR